MKRKRISILCLSVMLAVSAVAVAQSNEEVDARITVMIERYMNVKNAMVHDRDDLSAAWAERLETTMATTPDDIFAEEDLTEWHGRRGNILRLAGQIVEAQSIEEQREALSDLSSELRSVIEYFGNPGDRIYVFACGDYDDADDVFWLNDSEQVANPYHGRERLSCGEVVAEL